MQSNLSIKAKNYAKKLMIDNNINWYIYHNRDHVLDVYQRANYLSEKEWINDDLREMLFIWVYFHDVAYNKDWKNHEFLSSKIAEDFLSKENYPLDRIDMVKNIILSTTLGQEPYNILEEIIKDSDVDNLSRLDFFEKSILVKKEMEFLLWEEIKDLDWYKNNYALLRKLKLYTNTQKDERTKQLEINKNKLYSYIKNK